MYARLGSTTIEELYYERLLIKMKDPTNLDHIAYLKRQAKFYSPALEIEDNTESMETFQ